MNAHSEIVQAIQKDDLNSFQSLISSITDVGANKFSLDFKYQPIPSSNLSLLHISAALDSIECFKYLHEVKQLSLRSPSPENLYPIHYACFYGCSKVLHYILSQDPEEAILHPEKDYKYSLLLLSLLGKKNDIIKELLENGAKITDPLNDQYKLIEKAIGLHNNDIFNLIYDLRDPNYQPPPEKSTYAEIAIIMHNEIALDKIITSEKIDFTQDNPINRRIISMILKNDRDYKFKNILIKILSNDTSNIIIEPPEEQGVLCEGACHFACHYCDVDVANLIFKTKNFNMHRFDQKRHTGPFLLINRRGTIVCDMLKCLIENGFDINSRYDENSPTLLQGFIDNIVKRYEAMELLIKYGADINALHSKEKDQDGKRLTLLQCINRRKGFSSDFLEFLKDS